MFTINQMIIMVLQVPAAAAKSLQSVRLFATPWTVAHQALLSMGFSRQEYWNVLPFPSPPSTRYVANCLSDFTALKSHHCSVL